MWQQYMDFLTAHHRRPSKYKPEERDLVNWMKHNRKLVNQGTFPEHRLKLFNELLKKAAGYQRINQYQYTDGRTVDNGKAKTKYQEPCLSLFETTEATDPSTSKP